MPIRRDLKQTRVSTLYTLVTHILPSLFPHSSSPHSSPACFCCAAAALLFRQFDGSSSELDVSSINDSTVGAGITSVRVALWVGKGGRFPLPAARAVLLILFIHSELNVRLSEIRRQNLYVNVTLQVSSASVDQGVVISSPNLLAKSTHYSFCASHIAATSTTLLPRYNIYNSYL